MENIERTSGGDIILYNDSDPVIYDSSGTWAYDEQTTVIDNGEIKTQTTLDRTLGATPLLTANIVLPEGLRKEAFLDSKGNCVAVQLAALLKTPLDRIEREIDQIFAKADK